MADVSRDDGRANGTQTTREREGTREREETGGPVGLAAHPVPVVPPGETPPGEGCLSGALGEQDSPDAPVPSNRTPMIIALVWIAVITMMMVGMVVGLAVGVITG